jgi:outer membrane biosynthesis protein TonB
MKAINMTRILFLIAGILIFSTATFAGKTAKAPARDIRTAIQETIQFPDLSYRDCCTGTVDVLFTVTAEGKINIKKIESENARIIEAVKSQLSKVICPDLNCPTYQRYSIQLTFKLV